ncbi:hypothetical protein GRZ55_11565 [Chelativorans sp. ZYF759]|uniref:hypothetical protein n=1 Tax=Chelativorans sp. ZYF759 TaxID=2692213 RepID=UPI00145F4CBE|nr:hypothetical protein [Chelativorans sp. ZYF759]NMG39881.1 hypothetical protein [Chelativorans sp. ZYF759]
MSIEILDLPCVGLETLRFDPIVPKSVNRMIGRRTEGRRYGTPYWVAEYLSPSQKLGSFGEVDAFLARLESGAVFRACDTSRQRPIAYAGAPLSGTRAGGGAFDGRGHLSAIANPHTITVQQLPAAFQLRPGDAVELRMSALVTSLHRITAEAQANGSGTVTLAVHPAIDTQNITAGGTLRARFERPSCIMQLAGFEAPRRRGGRSQSFSAQEVFFYEP